MRKQVTGILVRFSIIQDFLRALWDYKLWWSIPIILVILLLMVLLLAAGHTGGAAFIYPLF